MTTLGNLLLWLTFFAAGASVIALFIGHRQGEKEGEGATNTGYLAHVRRLRHPHRLGRHPARGLLPRGLHVPVRGREPLDRRLEPLVALQDLRRVGRPRGLAALLGVARRVLRRVRRLQAHVRDRRALQHVARGLQHRPALLRRSRSSSRSNNPFKVSPAEWLGPDGELCCVAMGMNPLLQHWAMILHPPTLFIGYAGLVVPVRVRHRRAHRRRRLQALGHAHRPHHRLLVAVPRHRHRAGRHLGLRRARLGRLLGVGPGRERLAASVAHRRGPAALASPSIAVAGRFKKWAVCMATATLRPGASSARSSRARASSSRCTRSRRTRCRSGSSWR